jgi:predicted dehydrogenase
VHAIDTARFLLGDPTPERVCATVGRRYGDYQVDDDDILLISWSNGTNSIIEAGWWQPHLGGLEADTEVYGTRGYTRIFSTDEPAEDYDHTAQPMYTEQVRAFIDGVLEGRQPRPSGEDGRVVMNIVDEAYASGGWSGSSAP